MILSILLFIIVIAVLVFVHELGHFLVAKWSGIRVDEFAIGFPPTIWSKQVGETKYSLNVIPFGGYVKIHGENPDEESISGTDSGRSMVNKPKYIQALVLIAGIAFNIIFAWILISISLSTGLPTSINENTNSKYIINPQVMVLDTLKDSPAEKAGLQKGDILIGEKSITDVQDMIRGSDGAELQFVVLRGEETLNIYAAPTKADENAPYTIGISMDEVGTYKVPFYIAPIEGAKLTISSMKAITIGLAGFLGRIFVGQPDFSQVTGPIGIVSLVGTASSFGLVYLLGFVALISLNLAIINLIPFPALDGGRLLFVLIEALKGSRIKPEIANSVNAIGFGLLILLMLVVTYKDIIRLILK
jgi:regulator of sigma E protease